MRKLTIGLIMPGEPSGFFWTTKPWFEPGGLLVVGGLTPDRHDIWLWSELADGPVTQKNLPEADLYCLSGLTSTRFRSYEIARIIRAKGKQVVVGGFDVTGHYRDSPEAHERELLSHYDAIVVGRLNRQLWLRILGEFELGTMSGTYRVDPRDQWEPLFPQHELGRRVCIFPSIRTSDGCNQACSFCTVHITAGAHRTVYGKPIEMLERELTSLGPARYFADTSDSFGADYAHTIEVALPFWRNSGKHWITEIQVAHLVGLNNRPALLKGMTDAGCRGVFLGIEGIQHSSGSKWVGAPLVEDAIRQCHDLGVIVMGSFILDLTGKESPDSIRQMIDWTIANKLDLVQFALAGALPGSALRTSVLKQGQLISLNPTHLDCTWPTIAHPISPKERIKLLLESYDKAYSPGGISRRLLHPSNLHYYLRLPVMMLGNWAIGKPSRNLDPEARYKHWLQTKDIATVPA